jgi:hypothetical protein
MMALYSSGGIDAHNAYAQNIHNINQSVHSFNHGIADQLDQLREAQDQEGSIEAGINMLKGSTALNSARGGYKAYIEGLQRGGASEIGGKGGVVGKVFGKVQKSRLATRAGSQPKIFAPVDTAGIPVDATYGEKLAATTVEGVRDAEDVIPLMGRGKVLGAPVEMFSISEVANPYKVSKFKGFQGSLGHGGIEARVGGDVADLTPSFADWSAAYPEGGDGGKRESFSLQPEPEPEPDFGGVVSEDARAQADFDEAVKVGSMKNEEVPLKYRRGIGAVDESVEVAGGEVPYRGGDAPTWSAEGKIAEAAEAGVEVGEDAAKVGAKIGGSAVPIISEIGWDRGIRGAGGAVSGTLDIYKDIQRVREGKNALGDNWASAIGNVANIVGSGLEVAGALGIATPIFELVGAGLAIGGSALEAVGESDSKDESDAAAQADVAGQRLAQTTASATTTVSGRSY